VDKGWIDEFPLTNMCERIRIKRFKNIRRSRRIKKSRKIRIQPLCGEYPSWVSYLFFKEENCGSFFCMILD
jgi:hypothetical protein